MEHRQSALPAISQVLREERQAVKRNTGEARLPGPARSHALKRLCTNHACTNIPPSREHCERDRNYFF